MDLQKMHEEVYRILVKESPEGIWVAELKTPLSVHASEHDQIDHLFQHAFIVECNQVFAEMYGYDSAEEIEGMLLLGFIDRADPSNLEAIQQFVSSSYRIRNVETHELDRSGNAHWFLNTVTGIVNGGSLVAAVGMQRDITAEKLIRKEREQFVQSVPPRQKVILHLMAHGHSRKEIAQALGISASTVETHAARLHLGGRRGLLEYGARLGL